MDKELKMKLNKEQKNLLIDEFEKLNDVSQEEVFEMIQSWNDNKHFKKLWGVKTSEQWLLG